MDFIEDEFTLRHVGKYEVQRGDTVNSIALRTGVASSSIRKWNKLYGNEVYPSQVIFMVDPTIKMIPLPDPAPFMDSLMDCSPDAAAASFLFREHDEQTLREVCINSCAGSNGDPLIESSVPLTEQSNNFIAPPAQCDEDALADAALDATLAAIRASIFASELEQKEVQLEPKPQFKSPTRILIGNGNILTPELSEIIREVFPAYLQDDTLKLIYSVLQNGCDMTSFFSNTKGYSYTLIIVQASSGEIFGGFNTTAWRQSRSYYGLGESFVFKIVDNHVNVFKWAQNNDFVMWSDENSVAMGGGGKGFAFVLTDDFYNGATNRSDTFMNDPFVEGNIFRIDNMEVWGFPRYIDDTARSRKR